MIIVNFKIKFYWLNSTKCTVNFALGITQIQFTRGKLEVFLFLSQSKNTFYLFFGQVSTHVR